MTDNQNIDLGKAFRLKQLREKETKTQSEFGLRIGSNQSSIGKMENAKRAIGPHVEYKILKEFNINPEWWHTGIGEMFINKAKEPNAIDLGLLDGDYEEHTTKSGNTHIIKSDGNYLLKVKFVPHKAYAGYLAGWNDTEFLQDLPLITTHVKNFHYGTYRAFEVRGDSMDCDKKYAIEDGDLVIGRKLPKDKWCYKLHIHNVKEWVIVHDGGIIIKHISKHDVENGIITCVSYNEDKHLYPDFDLNLSEVYELFSVVKSERAR